MNAARSFCRHALPALPSAVAASTLALAWAIALSTPAPVRAEGGLSIAPNSATAVCEEAMTKLNKGLAARRPEALLQAAAVLDAGWCVGRDPVKAAEYLNAAAKTGDRQAALRLARKFGRGAGVPQSYANAGAWVAGKGLSDEAIEPWDYSVGYAFSLLSEVLGSVAYPPYAQGQPAEVSFVVEIDARQPERLVWRRTSPAQAASPVLDAALQKAFAARLAAVQAWLPAPDPKLIVAARVAVPVSVRYDSPTDLSVVDDEPLLR